MIDLLLLLNSRQKTIHLLHSDFAKSFVFCVFINKPIFPCAKPCRPAENFLSFYKSRWCCLNSKSFHTKTVGLFAKAYTPYPMQHESLLFSSTAFTFSFVQKVYSLKKHSVIQLRLWQKAKYRLFSLQHLESLSVLFSNQASDFAIPNKTENALVFHTQFFLRSDAPLLLLIKEEVFMIY